ncbi:AAA family ATPase [Streptomyces chromofuscus]|uniref:AAA family ATPase n=1 Tax=Streptomyces chromofuscus TaxID=42881 RepID=A0A7M2T4K2_STRCW|nr:AAA family ATPase [Streptomyces chromofuscus]QOV43184.1 AAA family ATPase [Streptomyces chromofuscus]GGT32763.1 ATP-binding protein [Streptomyces chromofuscus]
MNRTTAYATTAGLALPEQPTAPAREAGAALPSPVVRDLRERAGRSPHALLFGPRDLVVITGLPGSGKSTLMRRAVRGRRIDSQDTRDRWDGRTPPWLPYAVYRPLVRLAHYAGLRRAVRTGEGVVVHDCGTQAWVRAWLAREARRRGGTLHLLLLDVTAEQALAGQRERGRGVSRYAFLRHRRAAGRLLRRTERGALPRGCGAAILLDRAAADTLTRVGFTG